MARRAKYFYDFRRIENFRRGAETSEVFPKVPVVPTCFCLFVFAMKQEGEKTTTKFIITAKHLPRIPPPGLEVA